MFLIVTLDCIITMITIYNSQSLHPLTGTRFTEHDMIRLNKGGKFTIIIIIKAIYNSSIISFNEQVLAVANKIKFLNATNPAYQSMEAPAQF